MKYYFQSFESPLGTLYIICSDKAVKAVSFQNSWPETKKNYTELIEKKSTPLIDKTIKQLSEYFKGKRTNFDLPLAPEGTDFQKKVWKALLTIPFGQTISYSEQARRIGMQKGFRAVGGANGKNPIPIVIPCHRVIGKNGHLVGYSSGVSKKKILLKIETELEQKNS